VNFEHEAHEKAYEKVGKHLQETFGVGFVAIPDAPVYVGTQGSCMVQVWVFPWGPDDAVVNVRSWVVMDMGEIPADCLKFLLEQNYQFRFGAFSLDADGAVVFEHTIPAGKLDREELQASVSAVLATADEYDNRIVSEWGGVTAREKAMSAAKEAGLVS